MRLNSNPPCRRRFQLGATSPLTRTTSTSRTSRLYRRRSTARRSSTVSFIPSNKRFPIPSNDSRPTAAYLGAFGIAGEAQAGAPGEPKGITYASDETTYPASFQGEGGVVIVALDDNGPALQAFDLDGNLIGHENLTNDGTGTGTPLIGAGTLVNAMQLESVATDAETGRLFLINQGDFNDITSMYEDNVLWVLTPIDTLPGDGNGDGWVDGLDYLLWAGNFGTNPGADGDISDGDYNDDGAVNGLDYLLWAENFGTHSSSTAVPEPTSLAAGLLGLIALASIGRRRAG